MGEEKLPEKLYKYRSWPNEYTKDILINNRLYLNSPNDFNDPFDCQVYFDLNGNADDWCETIQMLCAEKGRILDKKTQNQLLGELQQIIPNFQEPNQKVAAKEMLKKLKKTLGIFCFTSCKDNILMWSHYGNSHSGVCLEFDYTNQSKLPYIDKVTYSEEYPKVNLVQNFDGGIKKLKEVCSTKSKLWKYENEYRLMFPDHAKTYLPFESQVLTGIICGCEMKQPQKDDLIETLKLRVTPVILYEAKKKDREFGLDTDNVIGVYGG